MLKRRVRVASLTGIVVVLISFQSDASASLCSGGRYIVHGAPLIVGASSASTDAITIGPSTATISGGCVMAAKVRLRKVRGGTGIRAVWPSCEGLVGTVRLKGKLDRSCGRMTGTLLARKSRQRARFVADLSVCGEGYFDRDAGEECDDGNEMNGDGCDVNCTTSRCGNAIVASGEQCDDGNGTNGDACENDCTLPVCGNGVTDQNEECDDSNRVNGDGCDANCRGSRCGNAAVGPGEECDDGNLVAGDGCSASCQREFCSDGIVHPGIGEECDDGNAVSGDGCSATCRREFCGDGVKQPGLGEQCDDGNPVGGDGCEPNCRPSPAVYTLLGTWQFTYTIISTFTDTYRLQRVEFSSTGVPFAGGVGEFGDPIVAAKVSDLVPDPFPYEFALLDPGIIICQFFVFSKTGSNNVNGLYFQTYVNFDGTCGDISSRGYAMNGIRTSLSAMLEIPLAFAVRRTRQLRAAEEVGFAGGAPAGEDTRRLLEAVRALRAK